MSIAAASYHVLDQDLWNDPGPTLGAMSERIEVMELLRGRVLPAAKSPLAIRLLPSSGPSFPDLVSYLLPLFSDRLRRALEGAGVDNVEYRQTDLFAGDCRVATYWLANVLGLVRCVDLERSEATPYLGAASYELRAFTIDPARADGARLFRLAESSQLLIVDARVRDALAGAGLRGLRLRPTETYDGY